MITVAAIWYLEDQNAPSDPLLLRFAVPATATREQWVGELSAFYARETACEEEGELAPPVVRFAPGAGWGHVCVEGRGLSLFVTFPREIARALGLPGAEAFSD